MAAISTVLAIGSLVVAAGSAYESYSQGQKAARKQKAAREVALADSAASHQQSIRNQVRQERVRRAQILQASENTGTTASSGSVGGVSALQTDVGSNIGVLTRSDESRQAISHLGQAAADATGRAATFGQLSNVFASSFKLFANTDSAKSDFNRWFNQGS